MQSFNPSKYRNPMVKKTVARTAPGKKQQFMRVKQRLDPQKSVKEPKRNPHNDAEKLPSGNLLHSHGKSRFFIGKPSINGPFSMAMLNNQRVYNLHYLNGDLLFYFFGMTIEKARWIASTSTGTTMKIQTSDHAKNIEARQPWYKLKKSGRQNPPMAVGRTIECSQTPLEISTMAVKHSENVKMMSPRTF